MTKLAEKYGPAVLIVAHRRKTGGNIADDLALGSRAFTGIARSVWHLTRDSDDKSRRLLLKRITHKAGLKPWPRLFQNLRSARETELTESFPLHVVTAWIGNSQLVARKHHLQVTDEHFANAAQNPTHEAYKAQKTAQQPTVLCRGMSHEPPLPDPENEDTLVTANCCKSLQDKHLGDEGIEPSTAALRVRCSTN